jgi:hypothetical protein
MAAPAPWPGEHLQAAHELRLLTALVVADPQAAASLALLVDDQRIHPEGALVLGALLQIAGHGEGAQFWWQFAAGGGSHTAASGLNLLHRSRGEARDADFWRLQAERLADTPGPPRPAPAPAADLLPAHVRADLLTRCHNGLDLRLPPRLAAVIHQLPVGRSDRDHGQLPRLPTRLLRHLLAAAAAG